jgi:hypothetical protein
MSYIWNKSNKWRKKNGVLAIYINVVQSYFYLKKKKKTEERGIFKKLKT